MRHHNSAFFAAGPAAIGGGGVYIHRGVWLPSPHRATARGRIGEVWTSPRRESPRIPDRRQRSGVTSTPKAEGVYKSCWRKAAPPGAARIDSAASGRLLAKGAAESAIVPGSEPQIETGPETRALSYS